VYDDGESKDERDGIKKKIIFVDEKDGKQQSLSVA